MNLSPVVLPKEQFEDACRNLTFYGASRHEVLDIRYQNGRAFYLCTAPKGWRSKSAKEKEEINKFATEFLERHKHFLKSSHFSMVMRVSQKFTSEQQERLIGIFKDIFNKEAKDKIEKQQEEKRQLDLKEIEEIREKVQAESNQLLLECDKKIQVLTMTFLKNIGEKNIHALIDKFLSTSEECLIDEVFLINKKGMVKIKKNFLNAFQFFKAIGNFKKENYNVIKLEDFSLETLKNFHSFLNEEKKDEKLSLEDRFEVYRLLNFFDSRTLKEVYAPFIYEKLTHNEKLHYLTLPDVFLSANDPLMEKILDYAALNFNLIFSSNLVTLIQPVYFLQILKRDRIDVFSEEFLFEKVVYWAKRQGDVVEVLLKEIQGERMVDQIRFEHVSNPQKLFSFDKDNLLLDICKENKLKRVPRPDLTKTYMVNVGGQRKYLTYMKIKVNDYVGTSDVPLRSNPFYYQNKLNTFYIQNLGFYTGIGTDSSFNFDVYYSFLGGSFGHFKKTVVQYKNSHYSNVYYLEDETFSKSIDEIMNFGQGKEEYFWLRVEIEPAAINR